MVWDLLLGSVLSSMAGLVLALTTALLTDRREKRRWLRRKVHYPLYGELTRVISGEMPRGESGYASLWAGLDYYKTYRVDPELAESLDRYASDVSRLAGQERDGDVAAFVRALPDDVCGAEGVAELPSGRTVDMRTWLKRNLLVLSTAPSFREASFGFEPADLDFLWDEVDGVSAADVRSEPFDTARALEEVSREFNWGYEPFYRQRDEDWVEAFAAALLAAADRPDSAVQETLLRRHELGGAASRLKDMIEVRADMGLFRSLWWGLVTSR